MPGSSAALLSQWSISKSAWELRLWSLKRGRLVMVSVQRHVHVPWLSVHTDNWRPSSWYHSLSAYQLPLAEKAHLSLRRCPWHLPVRAERPSLGGEGASGQKERNQPRRVLTRSHSGPSEAAMLTKCACIICLLQWQGGSQLTIFFKPLSKSISTLLHLDSGN